MSTTTFMTAEELLQLPRDGHRYELIRGELHRMSPAGFEHGVIAVRISGHLQRHVERLNLGLVVAAETGFKLESNPDTVQAPDVAYVSHARIRLISDQQKYADIAPDLAIEVLSPWDSLPKLVKKCEAWLAAGSLTAMLVNPRRKTATVYQTGANPIEFTHDETLTVPASVPGWAMPIREMFAPAVPPALR